MTTLTARHLNQDLARAKRAAQEGPVIIADRGRPAHVLMSWAEYQRLTGARPGLSQALSMPGLSDVEFDPPRLDLGGRSPALD